MDLYLDCEWFANQKLFLIGYAYNISTKKQLYDNTLTKENVLEMLEPVNGFIYFYGPDIAMIEKNFCIDIRNNYKCVNLIRVFKTYNPNLRSYKLASLEKHYGIIRDTQEYKSNIFRMIRDWFNPKKRKRALKYNEEDVLNLIRVKRNFFREENVKISDLKRMILK